MSVHYFLSATRHHKANSLFFWNDFLIKFFLFIFRLNCYFKISTRDDIYTLQHINQSIKIRKQKNKFRPSFFIYIHIPNFFPFILFYTQSTEKNNIIGIDVLTMCEIDLLIAEKYNL